MSTNSESASGKARDLQSPADSVYDFLYHDVRRVASFLGQLHAAGHLQSVREVSTATSSHTSETSSGLKGGVPGLAAFKASADSNDNEGTTETSDRSYDPLWANAIALLDHLTDRGDIHRDIETARIAQFVLVAGALHIVDMSTLQTAWNSPSIKKFIRAGAGEQVPSSRRQEKALAKANNHMPSTIDVAFEMLPEMPHAVQGWLLHGAVRVWVSLQSENLVARTTDLVLKHGSLIPGEWHMFGVLDALPGAGPATTAPLVANEMVSMAISIGDLTRTTFGRPDDAYGMTPLLIFREVSGRKA